MPTKNKTIRVQRKPARSAPKKEKEVTLLGKILRGAGGAAGSALGGLLGQPAFGAAAGTGLGAAVSKWLGAGDYTVQQNSLVKAAPDIPMMHRNGQSVTIRHKEYVCDVSSNTGFGVLQSFPLNPGVEITFPWLSTIAANYQEYTFKGVIFHYLPTAGDAVSSTNNALGSVIMSTNYRATDFAPGNKVEMLNEYFSGDARPSETFCHPIECDPRENPYNVQYIRRGAVPAGEDPKTYDLGVTYLATSGMQAAGITVGELWVTYEVELRKPRAAALVNLGLPSAAWKASTVSSTAFALVSNLQSGVDVNYLGATLTAASSGVQVTLPAGSVGTYLVSLIGSSTSATSFIAPTVVNCVLSHTTPSDRWNNTQAATSGFGLTYAFTVSDPTVSSSITLGATTFATINAASLFVTQLSR